MKKILSLVLAVVMLMAMTIPAFATSNDEVAPCATCNGNHIYDEASTKITYTHDATHHYETVTTYYKCIYCPSTTSTTAGPYKEVHSYVYDDVYNGDTYFKCTECGRTKILG